MMSLGEGMAVDSYTKRLGMLMGKLELNPLKGSTNPSKMLGRFILSTPPPYSMLRYARRDFNHTILPIRNVH